jgi:uncharacterized protein
VGALDLAVANLTSAPVLAFAIGVLATALRADVRLPDPVYQAVSMYLLLGIGIKGGVGLREASLGDVALPALATIALGIITPVVAFGLLRVLTSLGPIDRAALAAHYGSTSLVTFTAALLFLEASNEPVEGFAATLLALLEVPGIIVALLLARRHRANDSGWGEALAEVVTGRSIVLLVAGLAIGVGTGAAGYAAVEPFFGGIFSGVLTLFLLEMGVVAGRRLRDVRAAGPGLVVFAVAMPVLAGSVGVLTGSAVGLSVGGAAALGVLAASASYIAAPAAVRLALPEANPGIYLGASLGVTFPFNLVAGIPLLTAFSQALG